MKNCFARDKVPDDNLLSLNNPEVAAVRRTGEGPGSALVIGTKHFLAGRSIPEAKTAGYTKRDESFSAYSELKVQHLTIVVLDFQHLLSGCYIPEPYDSVKTACCDAFAVWRKRDGTHAIYSVPGTIASCLPLLRSQRRAVPSLLTEARV